MTMHLALLTFLSGFCGIAYEQLYQRLLTTHLGSSFSVSASILTVFLMGIGFGSLVAHHLRRWLGAIEAGIGLSAIAIAFRGAGAATWLLQQFAASGMSYSFAVGASVLGVLALPAFLIGFSIPLFARYLDAFGRSRGRGFDSAYILYNLGAAISLLILEFYVLRLIGLRTSLLVMAGCNLVIGALVFRTEVVSRTIESAPIPLADAVSLFLVSAASGIYQLIFLKIAERFFGPFGENFTLCLVLALVGISIGTIVVRRGHVTYGRWLLFGSVLLAIGAALVTPVAFLWAAASDSMALAGPLKIVVKCGFMFLLGILPFTFFGGTVPALIEDGLKERSAGRLLALSSFGNCAGYLVSCGILFERFELLTILIAMVAGILILSLSSQKITRSFLPPAFATAGLVYVLQASWNPGLFLVSYEDFSSPERLYSTIQNVQDAVIYKNRNDEVGIVKSRASGTESVVINGYRSLNVHPDNANPYELLFGIAPALYPARHDHALVLGLGTGVTAGAVAGFYQRTTAIELNPAMIRALEHFDRANLSVAQDPRVDIVQADGLDYLRRTGEKFDVIYNTVTSPFYFSSGKLYTRDFFQMARDHLNEGGVYALWMDGRITEAGTRTLFASLGAVFKDCHAVFFLSEYLQLICADHKLPRPQLPGAGDWDPRLLKAFAYLGGFPASGGSFGIRELLESVIFDAGPIAATDWGAPLHTFDRPRLDYVISERSLGKESTDWNPYRSLKVDYAVSVFDDKRLSVDALAQRCLALQYLSQTEISDCVAQLSIETDGKVPLPFLERRQYLLHKFRESPGMMAKGHLWIAQTLAGRNEPAAALAEAERASKLLPESTELKILAAQYRLTAGAPVSEDELTQLFFQAPVDPGLNGFIEAVRKRPSENKENDET